ncbi:MAG: Gfo/Idh/MocA family oxidoreductase [Planctomycetaceae bacterium]|nr:Gfo/Idh/MocA family oxidoreductase [Planctomycetaceae bacterium]
MSSASRRQFLQTSAAAAAAASVPYFTWSSSVIAQNAKTKSISDRRLLGCIGTGDRWNAVGPQAMGHADCVAVCDVDTHMTDKSKARALESNSKKGRERTVDVYGDYRKLLDRKDIEVVTIVTPDHWHSKIAIDALKAGKDVYCEKPLTLTIDEGKLISKVLKETGRVFQVGTQQRSEMDAERGKFRQQFLTAVALCQAGRLGKIQKVECRIGGAPTSGEIPKAPVPSNLNWEMWLGQAPLTDYLEGKKPERGYPQSRTHYEFRWWYEYSGGKMTDWGAHHVDIATWAIGMENSGPTSVEGVSVTHPVEFKDGWPTVTNRYNAATKFDVKCLYPNGVELHIQSDGENGILIQGDKGELFVSRERLRGSAVDSLKDQPLPEGTIAKLYNGKKPGNHMANFFECIADRTQPISDVYTHHRAMTTCHLANIAIRLGRKLKWNPETEQIEGDDAANAWLKREARKGYEVVA